MARLGIVACSPGPLRLPHVARDNRAAESKRRLVANERRSPAFAEATAGKLVGRPKKSGLETAPLGSVDSNKFQTWREIAEDRFGENIVAFGRRVPAIDRVE